MFVRLLKWLPGFLGTCLVAMTGVESSQAEVNFCSWVRAAGLNSEAKCLAIPHLEVWVWLVAVAGVAATVILVLLARRRAATKVTRTKRLQMAQRWVKLSDELLGDVPQYRARPRPPDDVPEHVKNELWERDAIEEGHAFTEAMNRIRQRYQARIGQAQLEMVTLGIKLDGHAVRPGPIHLTNTFCVQEWATKLGAEGHRILAEAGESDA